MDNHHCGGSQTPLKLKLTSHQLSLVISASHAPLSFYNMVRCAVLLRNIYWSSDSQREVLQQFEKIRLWKYPSKFGLKKTSNFFASGFDFSNIHVLMWQYCQSGDTCCSGEYCSVQCSHFVIGLWTRLWQTGDSSRIWSWDVLHN